MPVGYPTNAFFYKGEWYNTDGEGVPATVVTHPITGGSVFVGPNSTLELPPGANTLSGSGVAAGEAYPEQYGAVGDGVADDGAAVQAAINAAGTLRLKTGSTYKIKNVKIPSNRHLDLSGGTLIFGGVHGSAPLSESVPVLLYVEGTVGDRVRNVKISGGRLVGSRTGTDYQYISANPEQDHLSFQYADMVVIDGVEFLDSKQDFISLDSVTGVVITGNKFDRAVDVAVDIRVGDGIYVAGNSATMVRSLVSCKPNAANVIVSGNYAQTFGKGITAHGPGWRIVDNTIDAVTSPDGQIGANTSGIDVFETGGAQVGVNFSGILISRNQISGRSNDSGVYLRTNANSTGSNLVVSDNIINAARGVLIEAGAGIEVRGNRMTTTIAAIVINGGTGLSVRGNTATASAGLAISAATPGIAIEGNDFTAATDVAIAITSGATGARVVGNRCSGTIGIRSYGAGVKIDGNTVTSTAGAAIESRGAGSSVSGNVLAATGGEAVLIGATKTLVSQNLGSSGTHGVRAGPSGSGALANGSVISSNVFTGMQFFGANITSGATGVMVLGNSLTGNTSGGLTDAGTGTVTANNAV